MYFALRSYRDAGEHYGGQLGSEPTPQAFLEALWAAMAECWRVLKPTGSVFVNLGDKRAGSGGHNNSGLGTGNLGADRMRSSTLSGGKGRSLAAHMDGDKLREVHATRRNAPDRYNQAAFGRPKSKMLLPHRFAIGCEDGLADPEGKGWIVRQDVVWAKVNGLPESVTDRTRDSHEYVFHLTKEERYFSAVDEIREEVKYPNDNRHERGPRVRYDGLVSAGNTSNANPLGKLPGSVWTIASEPLRVPEELGIQHFAAFPCALPLRCIKGWSPSGICVECGEARRPVVEKVYTKDSRAAVNHDSKWRVHHATRHTQPSWGGHTEATVTGYTCACPDTSAPTRPAVVLDVFGGTGTTAAVARALGRIGVSVELSSDYCRLAKWRIWHSGDGERAVFGTRPPRQIEGQGSMFEGVA